MTALLERLFRGLLRLHPAAFRRRFAPEMIEMFWARSHQVRGTGRRTRFWFETVDDIMSSLAREHRRAMQERRWATWSRMDADVRGALRFLRRSPGTTLTVAALMAIGIGAATTVFSLVNAVLLRPLPYHDADRIVMIWETRPARGVDRNVVGAHEFPEWQQRTSSFESMAAIAFDASSATLTGAGEPVALFNVRVTSAYFDVMGVRFATGRGFAPEHDIPGNGGVAVISHRLWRDRFGGAQDVIGRAVTLGGQPATIIGVAPASFNFPTGPSGRAPDVWRPIAEPIQLYRGRHYLFVVARMKPGVTLDRARADVVAAAAAVEAAEPEASRGHSADPVRLHDELVRASKPVLVFVFGGVACLVLIGCANVAGLLIASAIRRRTELGIRLALGASRLRVMRQLLAEGIALAILGGAAGIILAIWIAQLLPAVMPSDFLTLETIPVDWRVLGFAFALTMATGAGFGLAPALQLPAGRLADALRAHGRSVSDARPHVRRVLAVAQVALTVTLVMGAGLMLRTWRSLATVDLGFQPAGVLTVDLNLPAVTYPAPYRVRQFYSDLTDRLRRLPGVTDVSTVNLLPVAGGRSTVAVSVEGRPAPRAGDELNIGYRVVGTDYFRTMGIPLQSGRLFAASDARLALPLIRWYPQQPIPEEFDRPQPPPVAIVNAAMARQVWPNEDPIGRQFRAIFSPPITVVGVVENSRGHSLRAAPAPEFFLSDLQEPQGRTNVVVRTTGDPAALVPEVQREVQAIDPNLPLLSADPMTSVVDEGVQLSRFTTVNVAAFAGAALLLMGAGVYGLVSFTASSRTREIGLRIALGAQPDQIRRLVSRQSAALALIGLIVGLGVSWPLTALLGTQLFGVQPHDPITIAAVAGVVVVAVSAATFGPAHRAARTDPAVALRQQ